MSDWRCICCGHREKLCVKLNIHEDMQKNVTWFCVKSVTIDLNHSCKIIRRVKAGWHLGKVVSSSLGHKETSPHSHSHSHLGTIQSSQFSVRCMFLDSGMKSENSERSYTDTGRICKLYIERPQAGNRTLSLLSVVLTTAMSPSTVNYLVSNKNCKYLYDLVNQKCMEWFFW